MSVRIRVNSYSPYVFLLLFYFVILGINNVLTRDTLVIFSLSIAEKEIQIFNLLFLSGTIY